MALLQYTDIDGADCFINPHHVTLLRPRGSNGCRIYLGRDDHYVDVGLSPTRIAKDIDSEAEPPPPADPTMNLLS